MIQKYQGVVAYGWLGGRRFIGTWLRNEQSQVIWDRMLPVESEDKRIDFYDAILFLLHEVVKRNIMTISLYIEDRVVLKHLSGESKPKKSRYITRVMRVMGLLTGLNQYTFLPLQPVEKELVQEMLSEETAHVADDEENNPDLVMISFS